MSGAPETRRIRDWLCLHALPLWADAGRDPKGGFIECLAPDGTPDLDAPRRVMVQARQIYVYSHAAIDGLMPGSAAIAQSGFEFLLRHGAPDGTANGFVHQLDRRGAVLDSRRDLYDHAFLLMSFSWYYRASADVRALAAIEDISVVIAGLSHKSGVGYREDDQDRLPRRQNSHMHLLEAFLAAHQATGRSDMLEKAAAIVDLFHTHFFSADLLREFFDDAFAPMPSPAGIIAEPGHYQEWVWLLGRFGRATGRDMTGPMRALYHAAMRSGRETPSGLLFNEIWSDGRVKDAAKRLWPQTELVIAQRTLDQTEVRAGLERIFRYFLEPAPPGAWVDRLDSHNQPLRTAIPASSLYHLFQAFADHAQTP